MPFLRQEIDHSDHPPEIESSESVDRQVRGDPYSSETSEELLHDTPRIPKSNKNENHEQVRWELRVVADLVKSSLMRIVRMMISPVKDFKKNDDNSAVTMLKITR